jgi:phage repressor protein C with HTH and peptisase S24 domain
MNMNLLSARLKWCMDRKTEEIGRKVTQTFIASLVGVSRATVNHWMADTNGISTENAITLGEYFGVNYKWLEDGKGAAESDQPLKSKNREVEIQDSDEFVSIKRVDLKISAGVTGYSVEYMNGDLAPIVFRKDWVSLKGYDINKLFALKVSGQSMETSLYDDDLVVINAADTRMVDGEVYAVNYEGELVIKRMIRQGSDWILSSDNLDKRKYSDKLCHENCIVIGRVIYKQSERI